MTTQQLFKELDTQTFPNEVYNLIFRDVFKDEVKEVENETLRLQK